MIAQRLLDKVQYAEDTHCWVWSAYLNPAGCGQVRFRGRAWLAHRAFYTELVGDIPDELQLDHLCRNTRCVNPDHLEAVTAKVNTLRSTSKSAINAQKTHCAQGHPFDDQNTYIRKDNGGRVCKRCRNEASARCHAKHK